MSAIFSVAYHKPGDDVLEKERRLLFQIVQKMAAKQVAALQTNILQMVAVAQADNLNEDTDFFENMKVENRDA